MAVMGVLGVVMLQAVTALLVTSMALAQTEPCLRADVGLSYYCPATSCVEVFREPGRSNGYYWVKGAARGTREVYCTNHPRNCGKEGVWMRVGYIDTRYNKNIICPGSLLTWVYNRKTYCRTADSAGCTSAVFTTNGASYTEVCGMARGYQYYTTDAFYSAVTPDDNNMDGVSFTYGTSPRKHLWTYAAGVSSNAGSPSESSCPCSSPYAGTAPPSFVGSNYYCESGQGDGSPTKVLYTSNPLWDGSGNCEGTCCANPNMPWFRVVLNGPTAESTEMRLCVDQGFSDEAVAIDLMELYVRVG